MTYTIQSARFADAASTAAVIETVEAGAVIVSKADTPALWAEMLKWGKPQAYAPPSAAIPESVADWQFAAQAAFESIITRDEAEAWAARGAVPPTLKQAVAAQISDPDRLFEINMLLAGAKSYERSNPLVPLLGAVFGKDAAGLDEFWRSASRRGVAALAA